MSSRKEGSWDLYNNIRIGHNMDTALTAMPCEFLKTNVVHCTAVEISCNDCKLCWKGFWHDHMSLSCRVVCEWHNSRKKAICFERARASNNTCWKICRLLLLCKYKFATCSRNKEMLCLLSGDISSLAAHCSASLHKILWVLKDKILSLQTAAVLHSIMNSGWVTQP